jgi:hypothetical protein
LRKEGQVTEEERYQAHLKQQVQDALEATHARLQAGREKKDVLTVYEWIKQYGGDLNYASTVHPIILLGVRHLFEYWWKECSTIAEAAEWIRQQQADKEPT